MQRVIPIFILVLLFSAVAFAGEGRIELSQTCATALGCGGGDVAGFPVTISTAGSYVLTSDLTVPTAGNSAIVVTSDDVTIDLNGFSLAGPVVCSGSLPTCSTSGGGAGIFAKNATDGYKRLTVRNGAIRGMGTIGINAGDSALVERVRVESNAGTGISVLAGATIRDCVVTDNGGAGIIATGMAVDNLIRNNFLAGLSTFGPNLAYARNVLLENNTSAAGSADPQVTGGGTQMGTNVCGSTSINANTICP